MLNLFALEEKLSLVTWWRHVGDVILVKAITIFLCLRMTTQTNVFRFSLQKKKPGRLAPPGLLIFKLTP
jgi:nitric oxide reductase large subunit